MSFKAVFLCLLVALSVQILGASVSHAKLNLAVQATSINPQTGGQSVLIFPVEANVLTFHYGTQDPMSPQSIEECVIALDIAAVSNANQRGVYVIVSCDERNETSKKIYELIQSPKSFTILVPSDSPVKYTGFQSTGMRTAFVVFPNGVTQRLKDVTSLSIEAGRPMSAFDLVGEKFNKFINDVFGDPKK